jgi:ATP-binding cassette, subfamily B, multidrug efflux pump
MAKKKRHILFRLLNYYKPKIWMLVFVMTLLVVTMLMELYMPKILGNAINDFQTTIENKVPLKDAIKRFYAYAALFFWIALLFAILKFRQGYQTAKLRTYIIHDIRCAFYKKLQELEFTFFDDKKTGELISNATRDIERARLFLGEVVFMALETGFYIIGSFIIILSLDPKLSLVAVSTTPPTVFFTILYSRKLRPLWRKASDQYDYVNTSLDENISGVKVVKSFNREMPEINKYSGHSNGYVKNCLSAFNFWATRMPTMELLFGLCLPLTLAYGGYHVINGHLQIGDLSACFIYLFNIYGRMRPLGRMIEMTQDSAASGERLFEIFDKEPAIKDSPDAVSFPGGDCSVKFENVSHLYNGSKKILNKLSFEVKGGETVAIVGPTGSGKSTLVSLLSRFYDPSEGTISIDGVDIKKIKLGELRSNISLVFQETFLFSGTVNENIAYGKPDASNDEIIRFAKVAQADEFITKLPKGYDTIIGERGIDLSGGQKQRLAIARALIKDPKILVMDDCTASVDSDTEVKIHTQMRKVNAKRTTFIISQRLSTIKHADRIIVIDSGEIVQMGTHDELIKIEGAYKEIFTEQLEEVAA